MYLIGAWTAHWAKLRLTSVGVVINVILSLLIAGEIYQSGFIKRALNL